MGVFLEGNDVDLEGNKLGKKWYTEKPVSSLMGSEAPRLGGKLSGIWTNYSLHILIFNNSQIQYFPVFPSLSNFYFYTLKTFEKSSKNSKKNLIQRL